jgi:hypothetical protein
LEQLKQELDKQKIVSKKAINDLKIELNEWENYGSRVLSETKV